MRRPWLTRLTSPPLNFTGMKARGLGGADFDIIQKFPGLKSIDVWMSLDNSLVFFSALHILLHFTACKRICAHSACRIGSTGSLLTVMEDTTLFHKD